MSQRQSRAGLPTITRQKSGPVGPHTSEWTRIGVPCRLAATSLGSGMIRGNFGMRGRSSIRQHRCFHGLVSGLTVLSPSSDLLVTGAAECRDRLGSANSAMEPSTFPSGTWVQREAPRRARMLGCSRHPSRPETAMNEQYRTVFISDMHLGSRGCRATTPIRSEPRAAPHSPRSCSTAA